MSFFCWFALKTRREPRWLNEVEAECQIPANDPYQQKEPITAGDIPDFDDEDGRRRSKYLELARAAGAGYEKKPLTIENARSLSALPFNPAVAGTPGNPERGSRGPGPSTGY